MVALTGGIASGKTTVSDLFAARGVTVVDTDRIAHEIVEPGQTALQEITEEFGPGVLHDSGRLNRRLMREFIYENPAKRLRLEAILHPRIAAEAKERLASANSLYCMIVIPLFEKSPRWNWIDRVLVVDVDEETQIERAMRRDDMDRNQAEAILRAQSSRAERLQLADDVIENRGAVDDLEMQVEHLHERYLKLSASPAGKPTTEI